MSRGSVRSSAAFVSPHVKLVVREGKDKTRNRTRVKVQSPLFVYPHGDNKS